MTTPKEVQVSQLGIDNDTTAFYGDTPGEIVEQVIEYLRAQYNIAMPDADVILGDGATSLAAASPNGGTGVPVIGTAAGLGAMDPDAAVIVRRLRELLDLPKQ